MECVSKCLIHKCIGLPESTFGPVIHCYVVRGSVKYHFLSLVVVLMRCIYVLTEALSGIVMHCNGFVMEILAQNYPALLTSRVCA